VNRFIDFPDVFFLQVFGTPSLLLDPILPSTQFSIATPETVVTIPPFPPSIDHFSVSMCVKSRKRCDASSVTDWQAPGACGIFTTKRDYVANATELGILMANGRFLLGFGVPDMTVATSDTIDYADDNLHHLAVLRNASTG
jgi:hypothetical protein